MRVADRIIMDTLVRGGCIKTFYRMWGQFGDRKFLYYKDFPGMSKPVFMVSVCSSVKIKGRDCGTINGHDESSSIRALMKDAREVLVR